MAITSGTAKYSRTMRPADFESKAAEIAFSVTEDGDVEGTVKRALDIAINYVHGALGLKTAAAPVAQPAPTASDKDKLAQAAAGTNGTAEVVKPPRAPRKTAEPKPEPTPAPAAADPSAVEEPTPASPAPTAQPASADPAAVTDEDFSAAAPDISDKDLQEACSRTTARVGDVNKVRQTIGKFVSPPKTVREIPQSQRHGFLDALAALPSKG